MTESKENLNKDWEWKFNNDEIIITKYKGTGKEVTMPSVIENKPVVAIGNFAFYNCSLLTKINIPDGVREIGWYAFENCSLLTNITIPDSVEKIEEGTFNGCLFLIKIPKVQRKT